VKKNDKRIPKSKKKRERETGPTLCIPNTNLERKLERERVSKKNK